MADDLYRREALEHQNRRLFGQVILKAPPPTWWVTALCAACLILISVILLGVNIQTADGDITLLQWLLSR